MNAASTPTTSAASDGKRTLLASMLATLRVRPGTVVLVLLSSALVLALGRFSFHLAAMRIFQVDECCNIQVAHFVATGQAKSIPGSVDMFQFLLSWLGHGATRSIDLFLSARCLMLLVFWANICLLTVATGARLYSARGLVTLAAAATLAPLWDYGFEIRHDNVVLAGLLIMWCVLRVYPQGRQSYFILGALCLGLPFFAIKSVAYVLPLTLAAVVFPPPGHGRRRTELMLSWLAGALVMSVLVLLANVVTGQVGSLVHAGRSASQLATGTNRFGPGLALGRLLTQTPLLLALAGAGLIATGADVVRRGRAALNWDGSLPEALLLAVALAALIVNPTPYPYNLLHVVPYAFLLAFRRLPELLQEIRSSPKLITAAAGIVICTHLVPFWLVTRRHLDMPNWRQEQLMALAENLTDPAKDPVYDAIGMIPTRPIVSMLGFLHGTQMQAFNESTGLRWQQLLAARPPAVLIPSYRTDWLPQAERAFITNRYVPLADDFWVLGKVLPQGGGEFEIVLPGRYRISSLAGSDLGGTYPSGLEGLATPEQKGELAATLDNLNLTNQTVQLSTGRHAISCPSNCQPAVVWVGPNLPRPHRLPPSDHLSLFVNWY
jgi:hypothetical protein